MFRMLLPSQAFFFQIIWPMLRTYHGRSFITINSIFIEQWYSLDPFSSLFREFCFWKESKHRNFNAITVTYIVPLFLIHKLQLFWMVVTFAARCNAFLFHTEDSPKCPQLVDGFWLALISAVVNFSSGLTDLVKWTFFVALTEIMDTKLYESINWE